MCVYVFMYYSIELENKLWGRQISTYYKPVSLFEDS